MSKCYACGEPIRRGYPMVTTKGESVIICERCKRLWKKAKADGCKTENSSEKPNNCTDCKHWNDTEDGCADRHGCRATTEDSSTVPTSSILEQVDEPQTEWHYDEQDAAWYPYKHEDEPQK